ncbi:MAG: pitrilysin family protein [Paracoccaceae bacterium]|nr:pitrilysin family protein [Paracoccaceae bacterium]MDE2916672.1 pitrilysin family protein [Paracoccaceae bacterium]
MIKKITFVVASFLLLIPGLNAAVDIQEFETPNGIEVWLVEDHSNPILALQMFFLTGSVHDPVEKEGSTYMMMGLLEEGTDDLDAVGFQIEVEELGAIFDFDTYKEAVAVSAQMITEHLEPSVDLLRKALEQPSFDSEPMERVRGQILTNIDFDEKDPEEIAFDAFIDIMFGDHPLNRKREGNKSSITNLTREDIIAAYQNALVRGKVVVGAAGDITADQLGELLDGLLGGLPDTTPPVVQPLALPQEGHVEIIDFPTPQSTIVFGHRGLIRNDPDFLMAYVLNEVFGRSGFNSRLQKKLRVDLGLTYGIGSFLSTYQTGGMVIGSMATANETVNEAIEAIRQEWANVANEGITQEELDTIKMYLKGSYHLRFKTNEDIAGILAGMQLDNIPASYVKHRNDMIEAIELEDINRVAKNLFRPEELVFVVVGQPDTPS